MKWTEEMMRRLNEINNLRKIDRYFAIKKFIEELLERLNKKIDALSNLDPLDISKEDINDIFPRE